jgi:hypothetical protein
MTADNHTQKTHAHARLVDDLGGPKAVQNELRRLDVEKRVIVSREVVAMWRSRGVGWRYRNSVAVLAAVKGVDLPAGFLWA